MPLPEENTQWPPENPVEGWWDKLNEWEAWYSGDCRILRDHYYNRTTRHGTQRFWARQDDAARRALHVPAAGDVAATSASLLFSEPPRVELPAGGAGKYIEELLRENVMDARIVEAAEMCAALGGVYIKIDTDPLIARVPLIQLHRPSQAVPAFRRGRLWEVMFWSVVRKDNDVMFYLFELRERMEGGGTAYSYQLYQGREGNLGKKVSMNTIEETSGDAALVNATYPGLDNLGVVYVPNRLPNRLVPGSPEGVSDFQNATTLLDALDEAYTSWMRDLRLGAATLLVDKEYLSDSGTFDRFAEVLLQMDIAVGRTGTPGEKFEPIKDIQFDIRYEAHEATCMNLFKQIVARSGYNPQTFGLDIEGQAESGTALRIRERKSMMTRGQKSRYWNQALPDLFYQMQAVAKVTGLEGAQEPVEINVELEDSVAPDAKETAETIQTLRGAQALSQWLAVQMQHPDWDDAQIQEELDRIQEETAAAAPSFDFFGEDGSESAGGEEEQIEQEIEGAEEE